MEALDDLLDARWDILETENAKTRYVTCIRFRMKKDLTIAATIWTALYREELNLDDYRQELLRDINTADISAIEEEVDEY